MTEEPRDPAAVKRIVELKGFRIDLVIAVCALLVSSMATVASVWQSRVVAQQLASQVWPYVAFQTTYDSNDVTLSISNEGLGPARVRWRPEIRGIFSDLSPGHVIRVGGSATLFRITNKPAIALVVKNYHRMLIEACYCPIIDGNCWITRSGGQQSTPSDPQTVAVCPDYAAQMLTLGTGP
ncbi:MAG TPA: hypothetical protein VFE70_02900 [Candidatus Elarobacter sp.]|nr:hypothetical protein [Candidatus Elarobacter sp.]